MATGDINDMTSRLQSGMPRGWFGDWTAAPIISAVLRGIASVFASLYSGVYLYVKASTRILTATDGQLDIAAWDFFGGNVVRQQGQSDASFLATIQANLFAPAATVAALSAVIAQITGRTPIIFEPQSSTQATVMGAPTVAQAYMGVQSSMFRGPSRMASLGLPNQAFVIVLMPQTGSAGIGGAMFMTQPTSGGMSAPGSNDYLNSLSLAQSSITLAQIYAAINAVRPAATTVWVATANS